MRRKKAQVWIWGRARQAASGAQIQVLIFKTIASRGAFWQPVTGGVEADEDFMAGALREAREETGLTFASAPKPIGYSFKFESQWGPAEEEAFSLEALPEVVGKADAIRLDPKEHDECRWMSPEAALGELKWTSNQEALLLLMTRLGVS